MLVPVEVKFELNAGWLWSEAKIVAFFDKLLLVILENSPELVDAELLKLISEHDTNNEKFIVIHSIGRCKATRISVEGYSLLLVCIFVIYSHRRTIDNLTNFQISLSKLPFHKIVIDLDQHQQSVSQLEIESTLESVQTSIETIIGPGNRANITHRYNSNLSSCHVIYDKQVDHNSYENLISHLTHKFKDNSVFKIDNTPFWSFPGGRNHTIVNIPDGNLSFNDFKRMSPLDIWSERNMFQCDTIDPPFSDGPGVYRTFINDDQNYVTLNPNLNRFVPFPYCSDQISYDGIDYFDAGGVISQLGLHYNNVMSVAKPRIEDGSLDIENEDEYYDNFYKTSIKYIEPLESIFPPADIQKKNSDTLQNFRDLFETSTKFDSISVSNSKKQNYLSTRLLNQFYPLSNEELSLQDKFKSIFVDSSWNNFTNAYYHMLHQESEIAPYMIIILYFNHLKAHNLESTIDSTFFNQIIPELFHLLSKAPTDAIYEYFSVTPSVVNTNETSLFWEVYPEISSSILRSIFALMVNGGVVTSILSSFVRLNIWGNDTVMISIAVLLSISDNAHSTYVLSSYMRKHANDNFKTLENSLKGCYDRNDIAYYLLDCFDDRIAVVYDKYCTLCCTILCNVLEDEQPPPRKKSKVETNILPTILDDFFFIYVAFLSKNGCNFAYFENNHLNLTDYTNSNIPAAIKQFKNNFRSLPKLPDEPSLGAYWYRTEHGIFNPVDNVYEFNTPSLSSFVYIETDSAFSGFNRYLHIPKDPEVEYLISDIYLKCKHFIDVCNSNELSVILLSPILDLEKSYNFTRNTTNVQVVLADLNTSQVLSAALLQNLRTGIETTNNELFNILHWLVLVQLTLSHTGNIFNLTPASFLSLVFNDSKSALGDIENVAEVIVPNDDICSDRSVFSKDISFLFKLMNQTCVKVEKMHSKTQPSNHCTNTFLTTLAYSSNCVTRAQVKNIFYDNFSMTSMRNQHIIDLGKLPDKEIAFLLKNALLYASWFIRMGRIHDYSGITAFEYIDENRITLYSQLRTLIIASNGPLICWKKLEDFSRYLQVFCNNTILIENAGYMHANGDFNTFHNSNIWNNHRSRILSQDSLTEPSFAEAIEDHLYLSFAQMIIDSQFNCDTFVDLLKVFASMYYKGNFNRKGALMTGQAGTGKNELAEKIMKIFKTREGSFVNATYLNIKSDSSPIPKKAILNLFLWVDELTDVRADEIKRLINTSQIDRRVFHQQESAEARCACKVFITTNSDPKSNDVAANQRFLPFRRDLQYTVYDNRFISRVGTVVLPGGQGINEYLGVQLLLRRLPTVGTVTSDLIGLRFLLWHIRPLFFYTCEKPVSPRTSPTLKQSIAKFLDTSSPSMFVLNALKEEHSKPIPTDQFNEMVVNFVKKNRSKWGQTNYEIKDVLAEVTSSLSKLQSNGFTYAALA